MKTRAILFSFFFLAAHHSFADTPIETGRTIFSSRCAGCHNVNKVVTGPALAGLDERRPIDWIIQFVHSSQTVIKSGDPYAVAVYEKFNKIPMPDHPDLSVEDIKGVVAYIKSSAIAPSGIEATPFRPDKFHPDYMPLSIHNYFFFSLYLALILLLIGALLALVGVKDIQRKMERGE